MISGMIPGFILRGMIWHGAYYEGWTIYPVRGWLSQWSPTGKKLGQRWAVARPGQKLVDIQEDRIFDHLDDAKSFVVENHQYENFEVGDHIYSVSRGEPYSYAGRVYEVKDFVQTYYRENFKFPYPGLNHMLTPTLVVYRGKVKGTSAFGYCGSLHVRKGPPVYPLLMLPGKTGMKDF